MIVFSLLQMTGGGPLDRLKLNPRMGPYIDTLTELWGLDQPAWRQYLTWLKNYTTPETIALQNVLPVIAIGAAIGLTVLMAKFMKSQWQGLLVVGVWVLALWIAISNTTIKFNWGTSFSGAGDVWNLVFSRAGATFRLGLTALTLALIIGVPLGIYQAVRQYSFFDQLGTVGAFFAFSTPIFIIGIGLQIVLALYLERWTGVKIFYVTGMNSPGYSDLSAIGKLVDTVQHLVLPAVSIALISLAGYARFQRSSMLEVLHSDYLRTAKAKGLPRRKVIVKHALRNAMIPVVTLVSLDLAFMIGGAIITESIFGWPGIGRLYILAITTIDYPLVMAIVMVIGMGLVLMNIIADILYGVLDPRVRYD
ncbi:MAG: ABC transporter permease [Actinomycetota bacterium]|nr:ABC transporter permease [Actinomycetota bacterium]